MQKGFGVKLVKDLSNRTIDQTSYELNYLFVSHENQLIIWSCFLCPQHLAFNSKRGLTQIISFEGFVNLDKVNWLTLSCYLCSFFFDEQFLLRKGIITSQVRIQNSSHEEVHHKGMRQLTGDFTKGGGWGGGHPLHPPPSSAPDYL